MARERVAFWRPLAEDQGRRFEASAPDRRLFVHASTPDIEAVIDVLLDNVFSHTEEGDPVALSVEEGGGGTARLVVEDGGPGLPPEVDVAGRGISSSGSTGLGLAIAQRTAESSGGRLVLERSSLGGTRVVLVLGPAQ